MDDKDFENILRMVVQSLINQGILTESQAEDIEKITLWELL